MLTKSEKNVLQLAKKIISLDESTKNSFDESYIHCIKFIFTNESDKKTLTLPTTKKDKNSFQYLESFVKTLGILFEKSEKERHNLYQSEITSKSLGMELYNSIQNLQTFVIKKKLGDSGSKEFASIKEKVNTLFCRYLKTMENTLYGRLNLYFYYLRFFIESVKSFEFMLFYFLKIDKAFDQFEYEDFCPDLNSDNCLNLIILFFKSVISKEDLELLSIYALLIFKYKYIFKGIEDNIKESILEMSVRETMNIVKKKTLNNKIIFEYIFLEFYNNLNYYNYTIYPPKISNEIITTEENKEKSKLEKNEGSNLLMKRNKSNNKKNNEGGQIFKDKKEKNNNINQEQVLYKNTIISNEIDDNIQINISGKPLINSEDNSKEKNSINEGIKKGKNSKPKEKLDIIDDKVNDNSKNPENNNKVDKMKEPKDSYQAINNQSSKSDLIKKDKYAKNESTEGYENESNLLVSQREAKTSSNLEYLINEIKIIKKSYDELQKKSDERYDELQKKNVELQKKNDELQTKMENVLKENRKIIDILGKIQMRDSVKNMFNSFVHHLKEADRMEIQKDKNKKWNLIAQRAKEYYIKYYNSNKYKAFAEIMDKSAELMAKGNKAANLEYFEKDINRIIEENKFKIINPIKLCFLLQIDISRDFLLDGYDFLETFYENNMTRAFTQAKSYEQYFS